MRELSIAEVGVVSGAGLSNQVASNKSEGTKVIIGVGIGTGVIVGPFIAGVGVAIIKTIDLSKLGRRR
ncbi:hypothetical protein [Morganella morganii]|uniref:hypothetical protein n=1 Tax=Morganella morganii TaxID=582 RepID=UPI0032DA5992